MAWWNNIVSAVQQYFQPKASVQSTVSAPMSTGQKMSYAAPATKAAPMSTGQKMSYAAPRGVAVQGPTYSAPSGGGSGGNQNLPTTSSPQPNPTPSILSTGISDVKRFATGTPAERQGMIGRGIDVVGNKLGNVLPELNLSEKLESAGGYGAKIDEAVRNGWLQNVPEYMTGVQKYGKDAVSQIFNWMQGNRGGGAQVIAPNLYERLGQAANAPSGAAGSLPGSANKGQILPSAATTGAPMQAAQGIVPSPSTTPRGAVVPSKIESSALPANMQGLTAQNVNVPLSKAMTPEAIQSIGQLLLRSLLGNQSTLTSLSPGIAQALWGAPTASSPFGGYEGGAQVPSQTSITPSKDIPLPVRPIDVG